MLRITTQSGTTYHVCLKSNTWARVAHHPKSSHIRDESGRFNVVRGLRVGEHLTLLCPFDNEAVVKGKSLTWGRMIETTPVTSIRNIVGPYDVKIPLMLADISAPQPAEQRLALTPQA